jgi:hypothetical protein
MLVEIIFALLIDSKGCHFGTNALFVTHLFENNEVS